MKQMILLSCAVMLMFGCDPKKDVKTPVTKDTKAITKTPPKGDTKTKTKVDKKDAAPKEAKIKKVDPSKVKPIAVTNWTEGNFPLVREGEQTLIVWKTDKGSVNLYAKPQDGQKVGGTLSAKKGKVVEAQRFINAIDIHNPPSMTLDKGMDKEVEAYNFETKKWEKQKVRVNKGDKKYTYGYVTAEGTEPGIIGVVNRHTGKFVGLKTMEEIARIDFNNPKQATMWIGAKNEKLGDTWFKYDPATMEMKIKSTFGIRKKNRNRN